MNKKAEQFQKFIEERKIQGFRSQDMQDQEKSTVFRSNLKIDGNTLPFAIRITDTPFGEIQILIAPKVTTDKAEQAVLNLFNRYNRQFKMSRFYISPAKELIMEAWLVDKPNELDGEKYLFILSEIMIKQLASVYKEVMKTLWD
ncbi:MAG: hypothetical protein ACFWT7_02330 [Succiniclasticum sp.]|jgi:leucyl-tRNA synthetase